MTGEIPLKSREKIQPDANRPVASAHHTEGKQQSLVQTNEPNSAGILDNRSEAVSQAKAKEVINHHSAAGSVAQLVEGDLDLNSSKSGIFKREESGVWVEYIVDFSQTNNTLVNPNPPLVGTGGANMAPGAQIDPLEKPRFCRQLEAEIRKDKNYFNTLIAEKILRKKPS